MCYYVRQFTVSYNIMFISNCLYSYFFVYFMNIILINMYFSINLIAFTIGYANKQSILLKNMSCGCQQNGGAYPLL